ncbi:MAG: NIPSNAP family protein [Burkholderiales bacterium]|nr:NIPSNAP family protein [Burkholderiales bacterium]ODU67020.1 MAG: hypothetical protein ABT05_04475 [Lautropia sp. SCN 66-9]
MTVIELRFEQLRPRRVPMYREQFAALLPERQRLSPLGGFWRSEVGNIDQIVQLWVYDNLAHRDQVTAAAQDLKDWPKVLHSRDVLDQQVLLLTPAPFSPPVQERKLGSVYELRIYDYEPGLIPQVSERWQEKIERRQQLSPLVCCGSTITGRLHQWVHLWAYSDANERTRVRSEALSSGIWPPAAAEGLLLQRNMLLTPLAPSPLA